MTKRKKMAGRARWAVGHEVLEEGAACRVATHALPVQRTLAVYSEPRGDAPAEVVFGEVQVTLDSTRLFLRTTRPDVETVRARVLTTAAGRNGHGATWVSVDDMTESKTLLSEYRSSSPDEGSRWRFFFPVATLLALARSAYLFHSHPGGWGAPDDFLVQGLAYLATPLALLMMWGCVALILLFLGGGGKRPASRAEPPGHPPARSQVFGQHVDKQPNMPGPVPCGPAAASSDRDSVMAEGGVAEGVVEALRCTLLDREVDGADRSALGCSFDLRLADGRVLRAGYEVDKHAQLFFMQNGDRVRVLGRLREDALVVEYGLNLSDGHAFVRGRSMRLPDAWGTGRTTVSFVGRILWDYWGMLALGVAVVCTLLLLCVLPLVIVADLSEGAAYWQWLRGAGVWAGAKPLVVGALVLAGLMFSWVTWLAARKGWRLTRAARLLGLRHAPDLYARLRKVCNEANVPLDAVSFRCGAERL